MSFIIGLKFIDWAATIYVKSIHDFLLEDFNAKVKLLQIIQYWQHPIYM